MKRTLSLVLVLAMMLTAMLGVVSFADAVPAAQTPTLVVSDASLEFANSVYLYVAVDYSALGSSDGVTLKITNNKTGKSVVLKPTNAVTPPVNCVAFKFVDLGASNMGDQLTIQALKDGVANGEAKTYSVLEYALKAQAQGDAKLTNLMKAMLQYGRDAQILMNHTGTYDLSKDYSLVKVGGIGSVNGQNKALVALGSPVTATASASDAVWYNAAIQRQGTGASFVVNTSKTYQSIYALPATAANSEEYELDMDKYTGNGGEYYGYLNEQSKMKTGFQAHNGVGGETTDSVGWFSGSFANTALNSDGSPLSKIVVQKGYIMWAPATGINFNSSYVTKAIGESVSAYATAVVNGTSTERLNNVVSLSITMAADGDTAGIISRWHLRKGGTGSINTTNASTYDGTSSKPGRLHLFQAYGTTIKTIYKPAADNTVSATSGSAKPIVTLPKGESGKPGEFVTFHVVIDLSGTETCPGCNGSGLGSDNKACAACGGDGLANTIKYYVGESTSPVAIVANPAPMAFFKDIGSGYMNGESGTSIGYLKAFTVTNGNITDYFK